MDERESLIAYLRTFNTEVVVALQNYKKCEEKPWEMDLTKGTLMNLLDSSNEKFWKVAHGNSQGFVPAEYLVKLNLRPTIDPSKEIQSSDARSDLEGEPSGKPVTIQKRKVDKTEDKLSDLTRQRMQSPVDTEIIETITITDTDPDTDTDIDIEPGSATE